MAQDPHLRASVWNYCLAGNYKSFNRISNNLLFIPQSIISKKCSSCQTKCFCHVFFLSKSTTGFKKYCSTKCIHTYSAMTWLAEFTQIFLCTRAMWLRHSTGWQLRITCKPPFSLCLCMHHLCSSFNRPTISPTVVWFSTLPLKNKITVANNIIKHYTLLTKSNDTMSQYLLRVVRLQFCLVAGIDRYFFRFVSLIYSIYSYSHSLQQGLCLWDMLCSMAFSLCSCTSSQPTTAIVTV